MDLKKVMRDLDTLYEEERVGEIGTFLEEHITEAERENAQEGMLTLYNEIVGYYRETGQYDKSVANCYKAIAVMDEMGLQGTLPYATTLLNVANAHRAAGLLEESMGFYNRVLPIYQEKLLPDDMNFAGFYNNKSLLYQEMGDFQAAKEQLTKALQIVEKKEASRFETAVTHANLANTCIELSEYKEAMEHAKDAIRIFEEIGVDDAHYSAALSALGSLYYMDKNYGEACNVMEKGRACIAKYLGTDNVQYQRLTENIAVIRAKLEAEVSGKNMLVIGENGMPKIAGLELCRRYYEKYGKTMIAEKFSAYEGRIAVGLVGKGSDCFGFDDAQSMDHDFGPRFMLWVTKETYEQIGEELQKAYNALPMSYMGIERKVSSHGKDRGGVMIIEEFYQSILGSDLTEQLNRIESFNQKEQQNQKEPLNQEESFNRSEGKENFNTIKCWLTTQEYALAAVVNGEVFRDDEGIFTNYRNRLLMYYPKVVWYRKIAQSCALFSQNGQYNLPRMRKRDQLVAAELAKAECIKHAMKLCYLLNKVYCPHDKWLFRGLPNNPDMVIADEEGNTITVAALLDKICLLPVTKEYENELGMAVEQLAVIFANELERQNIIGKSDTYLDANTNELLAKSDVLLTAITANTPVIKALSLSIAKAEFQAFYKVKNEGGRASCQNDWPTFKVMRMSQYMTWTEDMLLQYLYEFQTNFAQGRNMIEEKYARMMASTSPMEYARFADQLPHLSKEKKAIIEEIVDLQVNWMEAFAKEYPILAGNARIIHTRDDMPDDTSYETYLRGELSTYSDKMLNMYGRYIVSHAKEGKNVAQEIMENTIHFYGYKDLAEAEQNEAGEKMPRI